INLRELGFVLVVSLLIGGATLAVFSLALAAGHDLETARTEAVLMLALGQLAYLFNCRFLGRSSLTVDVLRGNPAVWLSALALLVLQVLYTYVPWFHGLFDSRPLSVTAWLLPLAFSVAVFLAVEVLKAFRRRTFAGGS